MAQPFVGEIRMFAGNFEIAGWAFCDGRLLPISENETLFTLIGTTYGGDGQSTFALPDLRGRLPIHQGNGFILAETGGAEQITLTVNQIAAHTAIRARDNDTATQPVPPSATCSRIEAADLVHRGHRDGSACPAAITPVGGSQPHTNFQPYLCINYIISLFGIFPRFS